MNVFEMIFTPFMLLVPLVFVQFYRPRDKSRVDMQRVRRLRRWLGLGTTLALTSFFAFYFLRQAGRMEWWEGLPWIFTMGAAADKLIWIAFFPLWFALAMPLLMASRPEAASVFSNAAGQPRQARSASLVARSSAPRNSRSAWYLLVALWIAGAGLTAIFLWQRHALLSAENPRYWITPTTSLSCALLNVAMFPLVKRMLLLEAEPMDEHGSAELTAAYATLRSAKQVGHFVSSIIMEVLLLAWAVATVSVHMDGRLTGIVGGVLGSLLGVGGATFGVVMSNRRMRINRLLVELAD